MPLTSSTNRSAIMRAVKSKNTTPELIVRRLIHGLGYRYRLHRKDLPGSPDIVFSGLRKIVLVNGCFWHGHDCARGARRPKTNSEYWQVKIARNAERDSRNLETLHDEGWQVLTVWECEIAQAGYEALQERLQSFLSSPGLTSPPHCR